MLTQGATNTFKTGLANGDFDFSDVTSTSYKIALYTGNANIGPDTTAYTTDGEVVASGYTAGGQTLVISQIPTVGNSGNTAYLSFTNVVWNGAITARGALIYLANGTTNPTVCVLDFGSDKTSITSLTVQFPTANSSNAIIRVT